MIIQYQNIVYQLLWRKKVKGEIQKVKVWWSGPVFFSRVGFETCFSFEGWNLFQIRVKATQNRNPSEIKMICCRTSVDIPDTLTASSVRAGANPSRRPYRSCSYARVLKNMVQELGEIWPLKIHILSRTIGCCCINNDHWRSWSP